MAETLAESEQFEEWLPKLREAALAVCFDGITNATYFRKALSCVFLKDDLCQVYPQRPACCRYHFTVSPPEACSLEHFKTTRIVDLKQAEEIIWAVNEDVRVELGEPLHVAPIPLMVLHCLKLIMEKEPLRASVLKACNGVPTPDQWVRRCARSICEGK